jgi:hypothetical protein
MHPKFATGSSNLGLVRKHERHPRPSVTRLADWRSKTRASDLLHLTPPPIGWRDRLLLAGVIALCTLVWGFIGWRLMVVLS